MWSGFGELFRSLSKSLFFFQVRAVVMFWPLWRSILDRAWEIFPGLTPNHLRQLTTTSFFHEQKPERFISKYILILIRIAFYKNYKTPSSN